ncbi:hypothetical protein BQ8420_14435 [Nocardiopsis sp. JB363]|nr:hypothetical protein BQ8420_14435 [Nocardiopsis sp. JB363]
MRFRKSDDSATAALRAQLATTTTPHRGETHPGTEQNTTR